MRKSFLFISCDEAKHICDKVQYGDASGWEKIKLNIRLWYCRITKNYSSKNVKLTKTIHDSRLKCLKKDERSHLQHKFDEELAKHPPN